jgi:hypothetical protein
MFLPGAAVMNQPAAAGGAVPVVASSTAAMCNTGDNIWAVAKPTGLAVGDTLVIIVFASKTASVVTFPSAFGLATNIGRTNGTLKCAAKVATSTEVATSTFTGTYSGNTRGTIVALRITGANATTPIYGHTDEAHAGNTNTPAAIKTPSSANPANSLAVMIAGFIYFSSGVAGTTFAWAAGTKIVDVTALSWPIPISIATKDLLAAGVSGDTDMTTTLGAGYGYVQPLASQVIISS